MPLTCVILLLILMTKLDIECIGIVFLKKKIFGRQLVFHNVVGTADEFIKLVSTKLMGFRK